MPSIEFLNDMVGISGPNKGFGFAVVLAEVAVDRGLQVDERAKDAALQSLAGERGKEGLDGIGPGAGGGCEMKHPAWGARRARRALWDACGRRSC